MAIFTKLICPVSYRWYNLFMRAVFFRLFLILTVIFTLTSCSSNGRDNPGLLSSQITLLPYTTISVTISSPTQAESTLSPSPTSEPIVYTVVAGDSLSAIALRFGVNLDALIAANPAINPNAMSIGTKLKIPSSNNSSQTEETTIAGLPTPVIQISAKPDCYRMDADTWICFLLVNNDQSNPVEDVTGKIMLSNMSASIPATCPLDLIPAGASLPLIATIDMEDINPDLVSGNLTSAIPVNESDLHYGTTEIVSKKVDFSTDLRSAHVTGEILLPVGGTLRVLGYAVGSQNHILGYRIWDATTSTTAGKTLAINISIFSLGGAISEVYLVAQARLK